MAENYTSNITPRDLSFLKFNIPQRKRNKINLSANKICLDKFKLAITLVFLTFPASTAHEPYQKGWLLLALLHDE